MQLPSYPDFRPLGLEDRPLLQPLLDDLQPRVSELTFAGLWLFRRAHRYFLTRLEGALVVRGQGYDGTPYALPPLGGDAGAAMERLLADGIPLYGADDLFLGRWPLPAGARVLEDRDNFDYLYRHDDLAQLPGNRYHKKKNRINYLLARHACRAEEMVDGHREGCLQLLETWGRVRGDVGGSLPLEQEAAAEAVTMWAKLGLSGVVLLVDDRLAAFALGERLNRTTSVCHFEKSDPFLEGTAQLVDREFNARLFTECEFVNREQDLGEPGLRNAKLTYHPVELVRKYRILPPLTDF
jgi:hypothetical protein